MNNVSELKRQKPLPSSTRGHIHEVDEFGKVSVTHPYLPEPVAAMTTLALDPQADLSGESVLLQFMDDDPTQPVILGLLSSTVTDKCFRHVSPQSESQTVMARDLDFSAANSVSIRCGRSQILMDKFGKIVVKGCNILTRASDRNRIKGGSVSLN